MSIKFKARLALWIRIAPLVLLGACQPDFATTDPLLPLDEPYFRCRVQPILTKSCSMFACHAADGTHGNGARYFQLYGRNRLRMSQDESLRNSQLTAEEQAANFTAARAMVNTNDRTQSYLLLKPLDQLAGGYYHRGADIFGMGNVFLSPADPEFMVLSDWVNGAKDNPTCIEPGSNL